MKNQSLLIAVIASTTAVLSGWMYQQSAQSHCYTELSTILVTASAFWLASAQFIKGLLKRFPYLGQIRPGSLLVHIPISSLFVLANLLLCQLAIFFVLGVILQCQSMSFNSVDAMLTNNVFVHFCGYFMFLFIFSADRDAFSTVEKTKYADQDQIISRSSMIQIRSGGEIFELQSEDVLYVITDKNCIILHTLTKRFVLYQSLKSFLANPFASTFVRIHRQNAINRRYLHSFHFSKNGDGTVTLSNEVELKCSRTYSDNLRQLG